MDSDRAQSSEPDDYALDLLLCIEEHDPITVSALMRRVDLCESDVNGLLAELRVGGLIERVSPPGYTITDTGSVLLRERERDPE